MIWLALLGGVALILWGLAAAIVIFGHDEDDVVFAFIIAAAVTASIALPCIVIGRVVERHYAESACSSFSEQSGRETKFVDYTYFAWDCLTPGADGKWISVEQLRDDVEQSEPCPIDETACR